MTKEADNRIKCLQCGACCAHLGSPPIMPDETEKLPPELRDTVHAFLDADGWRSESYKPCYFWNSETRKCRIYEHRPAICREFEPGSEACRAWRKEAVPE